MLMSVLGRDGSEPDNQPEAHILHRRGGLLTKVSNRFTALIMTSLPWKTTATREEGDNDPCVGWPTMDMISRRCAEVT
jgi:hypothetical protein